LAAGEEPLPDDREPSSHGRLLLAEDDPNLHKVFRLLLRNTGIEVTIAENGEAACDMAEKSKAEGRPYALILMDIQMPTMDGYEATRWLRQRGWRGPIVALTAHAMHGVREKCLEAGCDDYLSKPISSAGLRSLLVRYLAPGSPPADPPSGKLAGTIQLHASEEEHPEQLQAAVAELTHLCLRVES
jgi:CheY-like chemotaxis protein